MASVVALVLLVLLILTIIFIVHLKHRIREQNRKLKWGDVIDEVDFIIQVGIHKVGFDCGFDKFINVFV